MPPSTPRRHVTARRGPLMPARATWAAGRDEDWSPRIRLGDLVGLHHHGTDLGLGVVVDTSSDEVATWPVTDTWLAASAPCFHLDDIDAPYDDLVAWPEVEAAVGGSVELRSFGPALSRRQLQRIRDLVQHPEKPRFDTVRWCPERSDELALRHFRLISRYAGELLVQTLLEDLDL